MVSRDLSRPRKRPEDFLARGLFPPLEDDRALAGIALQNHRRWLTHPQQGV